jgi:hypothetical protein
MTADVTCPSCFEVFSVPAPDPTECPSDVDYDCEVCCRPMRISFWEDDFELGLVIGEAYGLGD